MTIELSQSSPSAVGSDHGTAPGAACMTVYHDGSCPLCQREISLIQSLTSGQQVVFSDVSQIPPDARVAVDLTAADAMRRFHVRRADGSLVSGAAAFIEMWSMSPRVRLLAKLGSVPVAVRMLDAVYVAFLRVRPPLSAALTRYDRWRADRKIR